MAIRFTKQNIEKTLKLNEGYTAYTFFCEKKFEDNRDYTISGGKLICHSYGKAPFDGRFDETFECDIDTTRRFLRDRKEDLVLPE